MSLFIINITNTSGKTGTIIADAGFKYTDLLNEMNEAEIRISGIGIIRHGLLAEGSIVEIKRNETREFYGMVTDISDLDGGGVSFHADGYEIWMAKDDVAYAGSPYKNTASATIATAIIGESTKFTAGTIEAGTNLDFRMSLTDSLWNSLSNLVKKTSQDIGIDYPNLEIDVLDHKGSSTSVATFNDGIHIDNLRVNKFYPLGNKVVVYGKGDGANQIKSSYPTHGKDETSQDTYGIIARTVTDKTIMSPNEANTLADAEVALTKDPQKIITFSVINPNRSLVSGDLLTINSPDKSLSNESVRIVGIERGVESGNEFLRLQVTNPAYKTLVTRRNKILARIEKQNRDANTYMQGATNVWGDTQLINANATKPLILRFYVPPQVDDEAGNTRINDVKLSYTLKDYRTFAGTLSGSTGNAYTSAGITNVSATTGASITNASATTGAGITNAVKGASEAGYFFGGYSSTLTGDNTWRSVGTSINIGAYTYLFHGITGSFSIPLYSATWVTDGQTYHIRAKNTTDTTYYPSTDGFLLHAGVSADGYSIMAVPFYLHIPLNWTSKNYVLQYKISNEQLWAPTGLVQTVYYNYHGSRGHTHSNTFNDASHTNNNTFNDASHTNNNTFNDAQHTNPAGGLNADYSLGETATSATDTSIKIYNSINTLLWDSGARGQIEEKDIDISSYITANDWYRIEIYPNSDALTYGTVYLKGGVDS